MPMDPEPPTMPMDPEPPAMPPPAGTLSFATDVLPILERHCTECHDAGRAFNFTTLPLSPLGAGQTVDVMLAFAATSMPPAPRDRVPAAELDVIRQWKAQGLHP